MCDNKAELVMSCKDGQCDRRAALHTLLAVAQAETSDHPAAGLKTVADQRPSSSCDLSSSSLSSGFWGTAHEFDKYFRGTNGYKSEVGYTGGDLSLGTPSASFLALMRRRGPARPTSPDRRRRVVDASLCFAPLAPGEDV